jgi:hypothetical protein
MKTIRLFKRPSPMLMSVPTEQEELSCIPAPKMKEPIKTERLTGRPGRVKFEIVGWWKSGVKEVLAVW